MSINTGQAERQTNADLERLIRLQSVDEEISRKAKLAEHTLPDEIEQLRAEYESDAERLKRFDEELEALSKQRRDHEMAVEEHKNNITKAKQKLPDVKTNVEYRAILKELDNFEKKIVAADDTQIELMERIEEKAGERTGIQKAVEEERKKFETVKVELEEAIASLKRDLAKLRTQRESFVEDIAPDVLKHYDKISGVRGSGVAQVKDRSCMACHQLIQPQLYYFIRTGSDIHQCPHCDRYLYYVPEETESG